MNRLYHGAKFLLSAPSLTHAPEDQGREVAFAGRSNAGKSSAINAITHQKSLARTSKTPGRTQQLVFFELDSQRRLVDLPGYGYARVPPTVQQQWQRELEHYLEQRQSLAGMFLLMDIRHPFTEFDQQMIRYCAFHQLNLHIALTKADKLKHGAARNALLGAKQILGKLQQPASVQLFSAPKKQGIDQAHAWLDQQLEVQSDQSGDKKAPV